MVYKSNITSPSNDIKHLSQRLYNIHETVADMQSRLRKNPLTTGRVSFSDYTPKSSSYLDNSISRSLNTNDLM